MKFVFLAWFFCPTVLHAQFYKLFNVAGKSADSPVQVAYKIDGNFFFVHFDVETTSINKKENLARGEHPYQFDEVEFFISAQGSADRLPYYEFEVSPLSQDYIVQVKNFKKPFTEGIAVDGFRGVAQITSTGWSADLSIPLLKIGWTGDQKDIFGNAYSILGESHHRVFWSLFPLATSKGPVSFHQPGKFQQIFPPYQLTADASSQSQ